MRRGWTLLVLLVAVGCGEKETNTPFVAALPPSETSGFVTAQVQMVGIDGDPLSNVAPIAALSPNAFEKPIAQGDPTGADGRSYVTFPSEQRVFVRGWDPALRLFANNFYEVPAGPGTQTELMTLVMAPGASLDAMLLTAAQQPLANEPVDIMMVHPTKGPWWPVQATTDDRGALHFPVLPPGVFTIRIKAANGAQAEIAKASLPPGGHADLGAVVLQ